MSRRPNYRYFFRFRSPEGLERRDLLSGHSMAGGFESFLAAEVANHHFMAQSNAIAAAHAHAFESIGSATSNQTVLTAQLTDATTGASANVTYKTYTSSGTAETEFKVSLTGADANSTLDVSVDGTIVGQITTDANGAGTLELSSDPNDSDAQPLPADFPTTVAAGSAVTVGTLSGTLATPTFSGGCGGGGEGGGQSEHTRLSTTLTDTASSATGRAVYSTHTYNGTTTTRFAVRVTGATADTTLDVAIDGTVVGQITTDSNGAGSLVLSSNPKNSNEQPLPADFPTTVTAGSTITVGTLSGTLATSEYGGHFGHFGRHR